MVLFNPQQAQPQQTMRRSGLPVLTPQTSSSDSVNISFSGSSVAAKPTLRQRLLASIALPAALMLGVGTVAAGCASKTDSVQEVPQGQVQEVKPITVTLATPDADSPEPAIFDDGVIINTKSNQVLGHFNVAGEAFIGDTLFATTTTEGKIMGMVQANGQNYAIPIGQVDPTTGVVTSAAGTQMGTITADPEIVGVLQLGAIAAITMFADQSNAALPAAPEGGTTDANGNYAPPANYQPQGNGSSSDIWFWMWLMNSNRTNVIYSNPGYANYGGYRTQYSGRTMDKGWVASTAGGSSVVGGSNSGRTSAEASHSSSSGSGKGTSVGSSQAHSGGFGTHGGSGTGAGG